MQAIDMINEYILNVCEQVRWKKARPIIASEIKNHIYDQRDAYISKGDNETSATKKAILQMGDAISIGQEFDKTYKPKSQWQLLFFVGVFTSFGAFINFYLKDIRDIYNHFNFIFYILAFFVVILFYNIDFVFLGKHSKKIYAFTLFFSILTFIISKQFYAHPLITYIKIFGISINLAYLSLIFPLAFALFVYSVRGKGIIGIILSGVAYLPFAVILLIMPSIAGFVFYTIISLIVILYAINREWYGVDKKHGFLVVFIPVFIVILLGIAIIFFSGHMSYFFNRINALFNPEEYLDYLGYLNFTIRDILSESIFLGKGHTPNVTSILPDISTDYSLTYLIHQFGFIILVFILVPVILFSIFGLYKATKEKSTLGGIIAISIMLIFIFQAFSYIISNLGYGLPSSFSLPFISYGNTSLFINSMLVGIMLSVFRTGEIHSDAFFKKSKPMFAYYDGKFIIDFKT